VSQGRGFIIVLSLELFFQTLQSFPNHNPVFDHRREFGVSFPGTDNAELKIIKQFFPIAVS